MATGEGTGTAWALRTRPGRKPAGLRDDHLFVASVLSLKDRRERSRSLGKPQPCCQGLGGGAVLGGDHRSVSPKRSECEVLRHRRLPQLTRAAASPAAPPAPAPAAAAQDALAAVAAAAAGSRPGPSLQPQLTSPLAAAPGTACQ